MPDLTGLTPLGSSERRPAPNARLVGSADPAELVTLTIRVRRRPDAPPLPDPASAAPADDTAYVSREDFAARYGAAPADLDLVAAFARSHGLAVGEKSIARRTVAVSGTVAQVAAVFGVELNHYATPDETYRGREGFVHVPPEIAGVVEGIFGLDNRRMAKPAYCEGMGAGRGPAADAGAANNAVPLTPQQVAALYRFPTPLRAPGQTIALLEFGGGYTKADLDASFSGIGLPSPQLVDVGVAGASNSPGADADTEVMLDIVVAGGVAQGAKIAVYFAPWTEQGWVDAVTTAVHDAVNTPSVVSISWGWPEFETFGSLTWSKAAIAAVSATFAEAMLLGVTVLAASGDTGSSCGMDDGHAHCLYPGSDPGVTTCGGTRLENVSGSAFNERTWPLTGGGISDQFGLPAWQGGAKIPHSANPPPPRIGRGIPDIGGNADPDSGYAFVVGGSSTQQGGTSAVAPLYSALVAIINARLGQPMGFLNPTLYAVGSIVCRNIADSASNATGTAPGYTAGAGWNPCTGWGVVNGTKLLNALVGWSSLGAPAGGLLGAPVAGRNADGRMEVFAVTAGGTLAHVWQTAPNNGWTKWAPLPTATAGFSGPPAAVVNDLDGRLHVFAMGPGGVPFHVRQNAPNGTWSTGASLNAPAGGFIGSISVARNQDGRLEAFGVGAGHQLWHAAESAPNGGFGGWTALGQPASPFAAGDVRVIANRDGRLELFALGADHNVYHIRQTAPSGPWSGWAGLGAPASQIANGAPFVGRTADGRIEVFATGSDGTIYHIGQTAANGGWAAAWAAVAPSPPGTALSGLGSTANDADGSLALFAIGAGGSMWTLRRNAATNGWNPWLFLSEAPPGRAMSPNQRPAVASNLDGRLEMFVRGADGGVWHLWETVPNGAW